MIIALDCDGILSDLMPYWLDFYNKEFNDRLGSNDCVVWDTHTIVRPECGLRIYDYLRLPGFFRHVPVIPGAEEGVRQLTSMGHDIVVVTDTPPEGVLDRLHWLAQYFPTIPPKNYAFTRRKDIVSADLLIDDAPHNILRARCPALIFDQPYNQSVPGARVKNWHELVDYVKRYSQSMTA